MKYLINSKKILAVVLLTSLVSCKENLLGPGS